MSKNVTREEYASGRHEHEEYSWAAYDARGIYLCRVCERCERVALAGYRPEILTGYDQSDVDEPIEAEDDW